MTSLPDKFDKCIIGKTVGPFAEQLVYSLGGLLKLHDGDREATALLMKQAYTDHGAEAPVFADDTLELSLPKPVEPKIITDLTPKVIPPFPGTRIPS
jgi:hypothetical protein